jgi:ABC-type transporter Mla maintaining outer membrane lipid asymmetry ATPase subunit MlaF
MNRPVRSTPAPPRRCSTDCSTSNGSAGLTMLMVTHRLSEARRVGGDLVVLIDGRIAASGRIDAVLHDPPSAEVRRFMHGDGDGRADTRTD